MSAECNKSLQARNQPYPRTCQVCRFGPCTHPASAGTAVETRVQVEGGKYTIVHTNGLGMRIDRYGSPWISSGTVPLESKFLLCVAQELERLQKLAIANQWTLLVSSLPSVNPTPTEPDWQAGGYPTEPVLADDDPANYDPVESVILNLRDDAARLDALGPHECKRIASDLEVLAGRLEQDERNPRSLAREYVRLGGEAKKQFDIALNRAGYMGFLS